MHFFVFFILKVVIRQVKEKSRKQVDSLPGDRPVLNEAAWLWSRSHAAARLDLLQSLRQVAVV